MALAKLGRNHASRERDCLHHPPPRQRGRGTTGAREASEPWWRGRGPRRFSFVEGVSSSPAPPPPPCFAGTADASRRRSLRKARRPEAAYAPSPAIAVADEARARGGPCAIL